MNPIIFDYVIWIISRVLNFRNEFELSSKSTQFSQLWHLKELVLSSGLDTRKGVADSATEKLEYFFFGEGFEEGVANSAMKKNSSVSFWR